MNTDEATKTPSDTNKYTTAGPVVTPDTGIPEHTETGVPTDTPPVSSRGGEETPPELRSAVKEFEEFRYDLEQDTRDREDEAIAAAMMMFDTRATAELPKLRTDEWPYRNKEKPNPVSIGMARKLLAQAYAQIPCELEGAGIHGYAWIIETETTWLGRNGTSCVTVPTMPKRVTEYNIRARWEYNERLRDFTMYNHLAQEGKAKIIEWFGKALFVDLHVDGLLPPNVTPKELLEHLSKTYAQPRDHRKHMKAVTKDFYAAYEPKETVEVYFMRLQEVRTNSILLGQPFTDQQLMNQAMEQFENHYEKDSYKAEKKWNEKDETEQTWETFKAFWKEEIHQWETLASGKKKLAHEAVEIESIKEKLSALQAEAQSVHETNELLVKQIQFHQAMQAENRSRSSASDDISALTEQLGSIARQLSSSGSGTDTPSNDTRRQELITIARNRNPSDYRSLNGGKAYSDDDEATVLTSNVSTDITNSTGSVDSDWTTISGGPPRERGPIPRTRSAFSTNYYDLLDAADEGPRLDCATSIVIDSGASDNFGTEDTPGTGRKDCPAGGVVMAAATGDCKTSVATDSFDLPLPRDALDYHVFKPGDLQRPLLSVGKACDAGCSVLFTAGRCYFIKDRDLLLTGQRDRRTGLYLLPQRPNPKLEHAFTLSAPYRRRSTDPHTLPNLLRYLHACAGFPVASTWIQAIRQGYYLGWPGLTASRVQRYLPKSEETTLGHLKLIRQGTRSTSKGEDSPPSTSKGAPRQIARDIGRRRKVMVGSTPTTKLSGIMGTDQTGRFPVTSDRDHKYIFVMFDEDINFIYGVPIKSRKAGELVRAFREGYDELVKCGFEPVLHRIDNETSDALYEAIVNKGLTYETVPPGNHRRNPAERAIQSFKSHFISILNGVDDNFPPGAWDYLIPQTNLTLNLLRPCSVNEAHSAYSYVYGPYDFNAHPLAPLGCRAIVHQRGSGKGGKRRTWENRGKVGYYIGPSMDSYRVWEFYVPETQGRQETDTAEFFPKAKLPTTTMESEIVDALGRIEDTLNELKPPHTKVINEDSSSTGIVRRLLEMYGGTEGGKESQSKAHATPRVETETAKVGEGTSQAGVNSYQPKRKQKFPLGTRVRVVEKVDGKRVVYIGEATEYDPHTGMYRITFEDNEWDDFNEDEMAHFRMVKGYKTRAPNTYANQLTVAGFYPKASAPATPHLGLLGEVHGHLYGLNAGSIWDEELHKWMAYRDLIKHPNPMIRKRWEQAGMNEFARLAQGHGEVKGMDVVTFIAKHDMPNGKKATYARYVVDFRPEKDEPWRLRITCGGDKLDYYGDTTTHSATMETIKCQLNNIVSTPGAKAACGDISNMYLGSDLPEAEYVRFRMDLIPKGIVEAYGLLALATTDGFVYARVNKAWYGLKQAGKIAHDDLVQRLADGGYKKAPLVEGYFQHETRPISFTLVVDDFLIKYVNKEDLEHLKATIATHYTFKVDEDAKQYVGMHLKWDYDDRTVRLSMDGYVKQALMEFEHAKPRTPYYAPSQYTLPNYGSKIQFAKVDESAPLEKDKITFVQKVVGKLLYYARAVDPTMLHAINDISLSAAKGTEATLAATVFLLNYAYTNPDTEIIYRASDMILRVDSDAAYLVAPEARSRAGGYQYLSNKAGTLFNGPVLILAKVIKNVMASAAEAELAAAFMNAQEAVALRNCLEAMGYPQPATPLKTDNSTACGILNNTMKQKRSKAIDVRFYWLRDRAQQGQFYIYWDSGKNNLADYHTKHHPPAYHKINRPIQTYIEGLSPATLQGCIEMMNSNVRKLALQVSDRQAWELAPTLLSEYPQQEAQDGP